MPNSYPYNTEPTHKVGVAATTGARSTTTLSNEGRLKIDAEDKVFLLRPLQHPLTTLLTQVGKQFDGKGYKGSGLLKKVAIQPTFKWFNFRTI